MLAVGSPESLASPLASKPAPAPAPVSVFATLTLNCLVLFVAESTRGLVLPTLNSYAGRLAGHEGGAGGSALAVSVFSAGRLVAAPALGAREEGAVGFLKGLGAGAFQATGTRSRPRLAS